MKPGEFDAVADLFTRTQNFNREASDICASHHKGNTESKAANRRVDKASQRKRILDALRLWGQATCDRIEVETRLSHQSCSARFAELKRDGLIEKVGTAPTRSGCNASVYTCKK